MRMFYVSLTLAKNVSSLLSLPSLSMSARVSVRIHHASLGVDQGENTSLFLLQLLLPSSNINGCWFFNEEVGVPVHRVHGGLAVYGVVGGRGREKRQTGAKHNPWL